LASVRDGCSSLSWYRHTTLGSSSNGAYMPSWLPRWRNTSLDLFAPPRYSPQRRRQRFLGCFGFGDSVCDRMLSGSHAIGRTDWDVPVNRVLSARPFCGVRIVVRSSMGMVASAVFVIDLSASISSRHYDCWRRHCRPPLDTARLFSTVDAECPSAGLTSR
jgi:hypothetical protein